MVFVPDAKGTVLDVKEGKSDGQSGLSSDHTIHGTDKLYVMLSLLFNSMICRGTVPERVSD